MVNEEQKSKDALSIAKINKVSIVIPIYNKEKYLENTLKIIQSQDYYDWEAFLVNDGSNDYCQEIAEYFVRTDSRFILLNQINSGVSVARNSGLELASGKWIWFIDADDIPQKDFLNSAMQICEISQFDVLFGDFNKIYNGRCVNIESSMSGFVNQNQLADVFMHLQKSTGYFGYLWCKIINRELIVRNNIQFKPGLTLAEDLDFMLSLYELGNCFYFLPKVAMNYCVETDNSSAQKDIDYYAQLKIQLKASEWISNLGKYNEYRDQISSTISSFTANAVFYANENGEDIIPIANEILSIPLINNNLVDLKHFGVKNLTIFLLKKRKIRVLKTYLLFRQKIRKILGRGKCR